MRAPLRRATSLCLALAPLVLPLGACGPRESSSAPSACEAVDDGRTEAVRKLVAAFNAHDLHALLLTVHPEVEWFAIAGEGTQLETRGARDLGVRLGSYFAECPSCRSKIERQCVMGSRVVTYEASSWERDGAPAVQYSVAVYEFEADKVRRVYYYPAESGAPAATP